MKDTVQSLDSILECMRRLDGDDSSRFERSHYVLDDVFKDEVIDFAFGHAGDSVHAQKLLEMLSDRLREAEDGWNEKRGLTSKTWGVASSTEESDKDSDFPPEDGESAEKALSPRPGGL